MSSNLDWYFLRWKKNKIDKTFYKYHVEKKIKNIKILENIQEDIQDNKSDDDKNSKNRKNRYSSSREVYFLILLFSINCFIIKYYSLLFVNI